LGSGDSPAQENPPFAPGADNILDFVTDNKYIFTGNNFLPADPVKVVGAD
jgi:hypothetical protein